MGEVGIDPANTLTLTFTNKAAAEMRERALKLMPTKVSYPPLLCTFHKFGLLFLKFHIEKLGRKNTFVIIDSDDKKRLLRSIAKELKIDLNIAFIASEVSKYKNSLLTPEVVIQKAELSDYKQIAAIYEKYQANIEENNLVDFDDLVVLPGGGVDHVARADLVLLALNGDQRATAGDEPPLVAVVEVRLRRLPALQLDDAEGREVGKLWILAKLTSSYDRHQCPSHAPVSHHLTVLHVEPLALSVYSPPRREYLLRCIQLRDMKELTRRWRRASR